MRWLRGDGSTPPQGKAFHQLEEVCGWDEVEHRSVRIVGEETQGFRSSQLCGNSTPRKMPLASRLSSFPLRSENPPVTGLCGLLLLFQVTLAEHW